MYTAKVNLNEIVQEIQSNNLNVIEGINHVCDRIEINEPEIHALKWEEGRRERLITEAQQLETKYPDPNSRPVLYGVLIGVKDLFRVDGFMTKAGSKLPHEIFEGKEASCVTKLKNAGALIVGKTVTTEFAYFEPGITRNPINKDFTPGGSSSGSAAAVAAGFCPIALGTQTIGSITRPASFCGIIGFKPSYNRISSDGVIPFSPSADHVGFFTQDIAGTKIIASILCNEWDNSVQITKRFPVLGIPDGKYIQQATKESLDVFEEQISKLQNIGFVIKRIPTFDFIDAINIRHRRMIAAEIAEVHKEWFPKYEHLYRENTKNIILEGQKVSRDELQKSREGRLIFRHMLENLMDKNGIDLWVNPSTITDAPKGISQTGSPIINLPWTYAGLPTITIPAGFSKNKLPMGLHFAAKYFNDEKLLAYVGNIHEMLNKNT
ncbi:MAG TPA: amidase [Bacteroidales bacterium]|nr:MAG: amidase [Bacteroidetes bacterium GWF2_33_38]OFY75931.1 MAG: amidase [Bacteroidetes bacterium RIFOXYA12_FULL_33_9]HBF88000.1 amidase [Bacteroidales bacterium]